MTAEVVLVPWDFSDYSRTALSYAQGNYSAENIRVVCVLEYPNPYAYGGPWTSEQADQSREKSEADFFDEVDPGRELGLRFLSLFGEPSEKILEVAEQESADLIVMPTHGRSGLQKLLMGSVAQKVVTHAKCPVLLLPHHWVDCHVPSDHGAQAT